MEKGKKGIVVFTVGWVICVVSILLGFVNALNTLAGFLAIAGSIVEFVGICMASGKNKSFRCALFCIIGQIVLGIVASSVGVAYGLKAATAQGNGASEAEITAILAQLTVIVAWVAVAIAVLNVGVVLSVAKGCKEANSSVAGLAKIVQIIVLVLVAVTVVLSVITAINPAISSTLSLISNICHLAYMAVMTVLLIKTIK